MLRRSYLQPSPTDAYLVPSVHRCGVGYYLYRPHFSSDYDSSTACSVGADVACAILSVKLINVQWVNFTFCLMSFPPRPANKGWRVFLDEITTLSIEESCVYTFCGCCVCCFGDVDVCSKIVRFAGIDVGLVDDST